MSSECECWSMCDEEETAFSFCLVGFVCEKHKAESTTEYC